MVSREEVLGLGLEFNLGGEEIKGDVFGEVLDFADRRYLQCFCADGYIL